MEDFANKELIEEEHNSSFLCMCLLDCDEHGLVEN